MQHIKALYKAANDYEAKQPDAQLSCFGLRKYHYNIFKMLLFGLVVNIWLELLVIKSFVMLYYSE